MAGENILNFSDASWEQEVLNSDVPVLVDFWAEWCRPCQMMEPILDAVAQNCKGQVKVGKLNVDENNSTALRYNIRGIPTLLLFKGGKIVEQKVGAVGKSDVEKMLGLDDPGDAPVPATIRPRPKRPNGGVALPIPKSDSPS